MSHRFEDSLEAAQVGTWSFDLQNQVLTCNMIYESLRGFVPGPTPISSEELFSRIHPEDQDRVASTWNAALLGASSYRVDYRVIWPDGSVHWIRGLGKLFRSASGQAVRMAGTCLEVSDQKRLDQSNRLSQKFLHDSEERYRSLASSLNSVVWTTDPIGRILSPQPKWESYTGDRFEDYRDFRWIESLHPDERDPFMQLWARACHDQSQFQSEGRLWSNEHQNYRHATARAVPLFNDRGQVKEWVGTFTDTHDRLAAELELTKSEKRFRFALNKAPLLVASTDEDLCYVWAHNPLLMFNSTEVIGQSDDQLLDATSAKLLHDLKLKVFTTGIGIRETLMIRRESLPRFFDITIEPLRTSPEEINGVSIAALDITDIKETEAAALAASSAKTQFIAHISHEIRTPIGIILGFSDLASEVIGDNPEAHHLLGIIRKNGQHLLGLIGEILDLSKIEADRIELDKKTIDLRLFLLEVRENFAPAASDKGVFVRLCTKDLKSKNLTTDSMRLQQILNNVVGNAVKFTERGKVEILVSNRFETSDSGKTTTKIRFEIHDTGIGLTQEQANRLFQPFSQADGSFARKYGGSGLGLLLSRGLARRLGGQLWLESSEFGKGSVFIIEIPVEENSESLTLMQNQGSAVGAVAEQFRVLVVEDSKDNQMIILRYLKTLLPQIDVADNGQIAVEKILEHGIQYDLILMDIQMPILDGYETLRCLRSAGIATPIWALTAHAMDTEREMALAAGFQEFITKPIHRFQLTQKIQDQMARTSNAKAQVSSKRSVVLEI